MRTTAVDFESFYSAEYSVTDLGYYKYARDPRREFYMISVCDGESTWTGHPNDFNWSALEGVHLISHSAPFDEELTLAMAEDKLWPKINHLGWECTLDMSAYLWNVRSLKDAAKIGLGIEVSKDARASAKGKHWADMLADGTAQGMLDYAGGDAVNCWQLWNKHSHKWPEVERRLSLLTREQGRYGVQMDVTKIDEGIQLMNRVIFSAVQNLPWVARGRKEGSPIGLYEECRLVGIPCPPVKTHEPEAAAEWEETWAPKFPFVMALRNLRKAKKALATLETMKLRLRPDGTMAFSLKYAGAHTLRWAGDGGLNLQNLAKEPLFVMPEGGFAYDTKRLNDAFRKDQPLPSGVMYLDMRGLIIARPGKILAPVDLSQIEPRVLNWLAGNFALLAKVKEGYAIYEAYAREKMGYTGPSIKDNDPQYYSLLKVFVLGCGYGAGWEKAIVIGNTYDIDLTAKDEEYAIKAAVDGKIHVRFKFGDKWIYESVPELSKIVPAARVEGSPPERCVFVKKTRWVNREAQEYVVAQPVYGQQARFTVAQFRRDNPEIVALWKTLQTALENAVGGDLVLEGPHGGVLTYRDVKRQERKFVDPDTGEEYRKNVLTAVVGGKRSIFHGPKLAENITQWVARNVFAEGLLRAEGVGLQNLFSVHDEDIPEIDADLVAAHGEETIRKNIEEIFSITPDWLSDCPIGAECKLTLKYKK
jgi:hypothetical protein